MYWSWDWAEVGYLLFFVSLIVGAIVWLMRTSGAGLLRHDAEAPRAPVRLHRPETDRGRHRRAA